MGASLPLWPAVLGIVCTLLHSFPTSAQLERAEPAEVCADFEVGRYPGLAWTFDDCMDVWGRFEAPLRHTPQRPEVELWRDTALELRQQGSPCMLGSVPGADGVGSTAIRHVATWIFAEEMGCDWLLTNWGKNMAQDADGSVKYCHAIVPTEERISATNTSGVPGMSRCTVVNWLSYFQFDKSSVSSPSSGSIKYIHEVPQTVSVVPGINQAKEDIKLARTGSTDRGWKEVIFRIGMTTGSYHIVIPASWTDRKRSVTRKVLAQMRENFHQHPRKWYDEDPHCLYDPSRLHFAVHVRMGDRHKLADKHPDFVNRLEGVMSTTSQEVLRKGQPEPLFHVFSETVKPCPSERTGTFDEFPAWPVLDEQVAACPTAVDHDGTFEVRDKAIMLHFDQDVQHTLSCMIQADGIAMGCSTFGQIGGLFSNGIKMFSTHCNGELTPPQYKMPPLAVAERGHLWVPIVGSWYDPVLEATHILSNALDSLLEAA